MQAKLTPNFRMIFSLPHVPTRRPIHPSPRLLHYRHGACPTVLLGPDEPTFFHTTEYVGHRSPIPSPIVGAHAGITIAKHLALDAGLQYSYTSQFAAMKLPQQPDYIHQERLRIHKAALPLTVGYAGNIWRKHIRFGLNGTFQYQFADKVVTNETYVVTLVSTVVRLKASPFNKEAIYPSRFQIPSPRVTKHGPYRRLMISAAYSHGKEQMIFYCSENIAVQSFGPKQRL